MASDEASRSSSAAPKLACLCSPTNHPGSFRCIRHRAPRARPSSPPSYSSSSSSSSASAAAAGRGEARVLAAAAAARAKGRSVRAHLLQMISSPSGRDRRRRRDFQPRPSRLRQCAS